MSDWALRSRLRDWRKQKAAECGWDDKVYFIFKNDTLDDLVARRPSTARDLLNVVGLGPKKVNDYGTEILRIINPGAAVPATPKLPEAKSHAGENWTPEDIGALCRMHSQGDTVKAMAAQLGRSNLAVSMKLEALGLPPHSVPPARVAHAPLPAPTPAALAAPAPSATLALHAGSKRKKEDEEVVGKEQQGAPAPSTPAKRREIIK